MANKNEKKSSPIASIKEKVLPGVMEKIDVKNKFTAPKDKPTVAQKKFNYITVITVDPEESLLHFSSMTIGNEASRTYETKKCRSKLFNADFLDGFGRAMDEYSAEHPSAQAAGITLVMPDRYVATDIVSIPTLKRKMIDESLDVAINDLYQNAFSLKINRALVSQNKQYTSFAISMMQFSILNELYGACSKSKMIPHAVTFASNSTINAVQTLFPKMRTQTYMLLDMKANYTRVIFVSRGRTSGFYTLPFGYSVLERNRLAAEDMLIDHSPAELLVLNAKEKARAKQLTMMQSDNASQMAQSMDEDNQEENAAQGAAQDAEAEEEPEEEQDIFSSGAVSAPSSAQSIKVLPKKQPRKLPKFMVREVASDEEAYAAENFRIFAKWALNLIQTNQKALWQESPEGIFVNMPADYNFVLDAINEEKKENGITFYPLDFQGVSPQIVGDLETYGGFYAFRFNLTNNF